MKSISSVCRSIDLFPNSMKRPAGRPDCEGQVLTAQIRKSSSDIVISPGAARSEATGCIARSAVPLMPNASGPFSTPSALNTASIRSAIPDVREV